MLNELKEKLTKSDEFDKIMKLIMINGPVKFNLSAEDKNTVATFEIVVTVNNK